MAFNAPELEDLAWHDMCLPRPRLAVERVVVMKRALGERLRAASEKTHRQIRVSVLLAVLGCLVVGGAASAAPVYPVKKGPTGRYLVDQNGVPFLIAGSRFLGDAASSAVLPL